MLDQGISSIHVFNQTRRSILPAFFWLKKLLRRRWTISIIPTVNEIKGRYIRNLCIRRLYVCDTKAHTTHSNSLIYTFVKHLLLETARNAYCYHNRANLFTFIIQHRKQVQGAKDTIHNACHLKKTKPQHDNDLTILRMAFKNSFNSGYITVVAIIQTIRMTEIGWDAYLFNF